MPEQNINMAIAGGENNNCLLNCIAHSLFSLPEEQLERISHREVFDSLMNVFKNYYHLSEKPTLSMLLAMHKKFDSPYDIEAIWGPVFREYLLHDPKISDDDLQSILANESLYTDIGASLANALGASITVNHNSNNIQGPEIFSVEKPEFQIILYHSANGGGHFNFVYPNDFNGEKAKKHNDAFRWINQRYNINGHNIEDKIMIPAKSTIYEHTRDINKQDERKDKVTGLLQAVLDAPKKSKSKQTVSNQTAQRKGIRFTNATKTSPQSSIQLTINRQPKPQSSMEESNVPFKEPSNHLDGRPTSDDVDFPYSKAFLDKLSILFNENDWQHDLDGNKLDISNKTNKNRKISMEKNGEKNEITFKCASEDVTDMLRCAAAYSETVSSNDLTYELTVGSKEQAKAILEQMRGSQFNLDKLNSVVISGQPLTMNDLEQLKAEISKGATSETSHRPARKV